MYIGYILFLDDIRYALARCGASAILIGLLKSPVDDIQSRAAIIISDIACVGDNQAELARLGAIPPLVSIYCSITIVTRLRNVTNYVVERCCFFNGSNSSRLGGDELVKFRQRKQMENSTEKVL